MIAAGSALILLGAAALVRGEHALLVFLGLLLTALGGAVIGPAVAAASLAYVGRRGFPSSKAATPPGPMPATWPPRS